MDGPQRQGWGRRWLRVGLVAVAAWVVVAAVQLWQAYDALEAGEAAARAVEGGLSPEALLEGTIDADLERAAERFSAAHSSLTGPVLVPLRFAPVVGRHLKTVTAMAGAAASMADVGGGALADARAALERPHATGAERVALARELAAVAGDARRRLDGLELGPDEALMGPVAKRRAELAGRIGDATRSLQRLENAASAVATVLSGPRRYLVLAANNAEMRAGSGMFLSAGVLTFGDGQLELGEMVPTDEMVLAEPVPLDPALAELWGWFEVGRDFRHLGLSPRFPVAAEQARRMWQARTGEVVDGVLALDVEALRAVVDATGPVEVDGLRLTDDMVVPYLLHGQYRSFGDDHDARQDQLGRIAAAALESVDRGQFDPEALATGLAGAARGRHLLAWAADPAEQAAWEAAGVAGDLAGDELLVAVLNTGANKLDQFVEVDVELDAGAAPGASSSAAPVSLRVRVKNRTPEGEPAYVAGPSPHTDLVPGEYRGLVAVTLPGDAVRVAVDGRDRVAVHGRDGRSQVVAVPIQLMAGADTSLTVRFQLPGATELRAAPSARIPPVRWSFGAVSWADDEGRTLALQTNP